MTDATVLADALVEDGIGLYETCIDPGWRVVGMRATQFPEDFINDWRVAGKVLESAGMAFIEQHARWQVRYDKAYGVRTREWHSDESLPRAIIEAWYASRGSDE